MKNENKNIKLKQNEAVIKEKWSVSDQQLH